MLIRKIEGEAGKYIFWCDGCECAHYFRTAEANEPNKPKWNFNGDFLNPTVSPSINVTYPDGKTCHFIITNGMIHYQGDCFHELRGKISPMRDFDKLYDC